MTKRFLVTANSVQALVDQGLVPIDARVDAVELEMATATDANQPETLVRRAADGSVILEAVVVEGAQPAGAGSLARRDFVVAGDTAAKARANHTGTQSADTLTDGTGNKAFTAGERTKLEGVAPGATANATDAQLRDRSTHTGTQTSGTISDLTEAVQDIVGAFFGAGTGTAISYNDAANTLTITATGGTSGDPESIRDVIGAALIGVGNISIAVNDAGDTITISTSATVNATDAALRDRSTHTGTQPISSVAGLQTSLDGKANTTDVNGKAAQSTVEGLVLHNGTTGGGTRPTGFWRVRWVGGTTRPTNMATDDVWEHSA